MKINLKKLGSELGAAAQKTAGDLAESVREGKAAEAVMEKAAGAAGAIKNAVDGAKASDITDQVREFLMKDRKPEVADGTISPRSAMMIIYYLMAVDGNIYQKEEEKFLSIGSDLDESFEDHQKTIVGACRKQMDKVIDPEDYYDVIQEGVGKAIQGSVPDQNSFITPRLLIWDLLSVACSDGQYSEPERRLIKYVTRQLDIDKELFLEMETSIRTLLALEKEEEWIRTTNRPHLVKESLAREIENRKAVIFDSVRDLITL